VDGQSVLVSPAGALERTLGLRGPVGISWDGEAPVASERWDALGLDGEQDWGRLVGGLQARHGWQLPPPRQARLAARERLPRVFGLSRGEFLALLGSPEGRAVASRPAPLAEALYPLWKPFALGLTLSYHCNASCGHCYNSSGERRPRECLGWKDLSADLSDWVLTGVTDIGLSGGEPFLFPDQIIEIVSELKRLGVPVISPFTNGFWGADQASARRILERLKETGFGSSPRDQIKISTGEFHQLDVSLDHVLTLCELHVEVLGTRAVLDVEQIRDPNSLRRAIARAKERALHDRIQWYGRAAVSDSGRAKRWYRELPSRPRKLSELRCPVRSSGAVYPEREWVVCSGTSYPIRSRALGRVDSDGVFALLARAQFDERVPYWQFGTFAHYLADHPRPGWTLDQEIQMPEAATPCGLCQKIFQKPEPQAPRLRRAAGQGLTALSE
jgi:hypothetical protein